MPNQELAQIILPFLELTEIPPVPTPWTHRVLFIPFKE